MKVCVIAREDRPGDKKLVAYVVLSNNILTSSEIRKVLKDKLPSYMVPSAIIILPFLPLTPNGKIARNELPAPQLEDLATAKYVAPVTNTQVIVAELVASVLNLQRVGMEDHFFDLGGHSLSATQLLSRLKNRFNIDMPLSRLLGQSATIGQLAGFIDTLVKVEPAINLLSDFGNHGISVNVESSEPFVRTSDLCVKFDSETRVLEINKAEIHDQDLVIYYEPVPENTLLPLSYNQQSLFFLSRLDPNGYQSMAYNIPFACKFNSVYLFIVYILYSLES